MTDKEFKNASEEILRWIRNYLVEIEKYPVKSSVKYHEIFDKLPDSAPDYPEKFNEIFDDFIGKDKTFRKLRPNLAPKHVKFDGTFIIQVDITTHFGR